LAFFLQSIKNSPFRLYITKNGRPVRIALDTAWPKAYYGTGKALAV